MVLDGLVQDILGLKTKKGRFTTGGILKNGGTGVR